MASLLICHDCIVARHFVTKKDTCRLLLAVLRSSFFSSFSRFFFSLKMADRIFFKKSPIICF